MAVTTSQINFKDVTNATTIDDGTGYFDILMKTINIHADKQYVTNRITGAEYATVYLGAMQSAIAEAVKFALSKDKIANEIDLANKQYDLSKQLTDKEIALKGNQAATEADKLKTTQKARDVQEAQRRLTERQILGFDDNKQIKAFEAQLNSWALLNSSGMIDSVSIPGVISSANLQSTYNSLVSDTNESTL